jgi:FlaA1/EpsC-like NDP-sugar epimerase
MTPVANLKISTISGNLVLFSTEMFFGVVSLYLAFLLKYDGVISPQVLSFYFQIIPLAFAFRSFSFLFFRFNSQFCDDPCLEDTSKTIKSIVVGSLLILLFVSGSVGIHGNVQVSLAILIIDAVILLGFQIGFQSFWKGLRSYIGRRQYGDKSIDNSNEAVEVCLKNTVISQITPSYMNGDESSQDVYIRKLLGREPVQLNMGSIRNVIQGRVVMITGAAGSIGTELCEQILGFNPASLIMIDRGENYLHELKVILDKYDTSVQTHFIYGSITNKEKMENVFERYRPDIVFHAAANKHVPIMEHNIDEAISNNIYGTKVIADLSNKYNVHRFVLISTDKVVKPTSIMGMTKRIAEQYVRFLAKTSQTRFSSVRFGNVLGSKGSVVPIFKEQIARGGPVTITHPKMERFLMLIPEAVGLILQTTALNGSGGRTFVLDMGCPVKIVDLARKMIQISEKEGLNNIKIKYVGIRPGEKLREELVLDEEEIFPTVYEKIKMLESNVPHNPHYDEWLDSLCRQASDPYPESDRIKSIMSEMIPDLPSPASLIKN